MATLTNKQRFLSNTDMAILFAFNEQLEDSDAGGYSTNKEDLRRLRELGVIQGLGFGRYSVTAFGTWLIETEFSQSPELPLMTIEDFNNHQSLKHMKMLLSL